MLTRSFVFRGVLCLLILTVTLGCFSFSFSTRAEPTPEPVQPTDEPLIPTAVRVVDTPEVPENESPAGVDGGGIEVDYVYTNGLVTVLYHLYGSVLDHFVDITLTNNTDRKATLIVETEIEGYSTRSTDTVEVEAREQLELHQNPRLIAAAVDQLNSEQPGNFRIRVVQVKPDGNLVLVEESRQILLYSRRDFVWIDGFTPQEEYELWAAWVMPTDPAVEALIRSAADYTQSGTMWSGYGGYVNDENGKVWERLEAIWKAEAENYRVTYISTMVSFGPNTVQRMRLPSEVLDQASGNCVELALLFASAAEALGLETAIIRIPGHAYMAVRMDEENANYYFVETTMIGQSSFEEAVEYGRQEWNEAQPHFDAQEEGYGWVTIPNAREKGILPIPWR